MVVSEVVVVVVVAVVDAEVDCVVASEVVAVLVAPPVVGVSDVSDVSAAVEPVSVELVVSGLSPGVQARTRPKRANARMPASVSPSDAREQASGRARK